MARYYDLDKLSKLIEAKADTMLEGNGAMLYVAKWLNLLPTADVVEVVRCKDCKHYVAEYCTRDIKGRTNMFYMQPTDFCSYGERAVNYESSKTNHT